jgi:hypothetical protein
MHGCVVQQIRVHARSPALLAKDTHARTDFEGAAATCCVQASGRARLTQLSDGHGLVALFRRRSRARMLAGYPFLHYFLTCMVRGETVRLKKE